MKTESDMAELTELLLPDQYQTSVQDNPKHSVSLSRFMTVGGITFTIFILFIIILASQLPAQQTMGMTTVGLNTGLDNSNWMRTIYGEYKLFDAQCRDGCGFEQAAAVCQAGGGHLPFIQSEEENEEIKVVNKVHCVLKIIKYIL